MRQLSISSSRWAVTPSKAQNQPSFPTQSVHLLEPFRPNSHSKRHSSCGAGGPGPLLPNDQSARTLAALRLLGIDQSESKSAVRAAYVKKMKILHPDVNPDLDTTEEAIAIVAAYKHILAVHSEDDLVEIDVFEVPEAEPTELFINPFGCNADPLEWRQLQVAGRSQSDPEAALLAAGVSCSSSAILWLSPAQLAIVEQDLAEMDITLNSELTAWVLADRLGRARFVNGRFS
ncbi:hypothetical protein WJX84_004684 [Apatococcus fuscideae]|uniref:J domain-containing protein n=1 Tax=Apatococcus fuscideae TaxID=2026836 RepID=A0AAW1SYV2_9CHLO